MTEREKQTIDAADIGNLDDVLGPKTYVFKNGDCVDCKGPCKGHQDPCDHPPNSNTCIRCEDPTRAKLTQALQEKQRQRGL